MEQKAITSEEFFPADQQQQPTPTLCQCDRNNQELLHLLHQSPFLPIIEEHVYETLKNDNVQQMKRDRIDLVVFEKLLEQICIGKYSIAKKQIKFDKVG